MSETEQQAPTKWSAALKWLRHNWDSPLVVLTVTPALSMVLSFELVRDMQVVFDHPILILPVWLVVLLLANTRRIIRRWRQVLLSVVAVALTLLVLHLASPLILSRWVMPDHRTDLDHRPKPQPGHTNEDGVQPPLPSANYKPHNYNVVFLGDSFTRGVGVRHDKNFVSLVEGQLRARFKGLQVMVVNFAWEGSSPLLQLRQLRDIGGKYSPDLVVQVLDMGDFRDDNTYEQLLRDKADGQAFPVTLLDVLWDALGRAMGVGHFGEWITDQFIFGPAPGDRTGPSPYDEVHKPIDPKNRYFHAWQPLSHSRPYFDATWSNIKQTRSQAHKLGAKYTLMVLPRYPQYNRKECPQDPERKAWPKDDRYLFEAFKYLDAKAKKAPFPVHSLLNDFRATKIFPTVFKHDEHFSVGGHKVAAKAILGYLLKDGSLDKLRAEAKAARDRPDGGTRPRRPPRGDAGAAVKTTPRKAP